MIKNYIKTAFRNFNRHKSPFLINVIGLSIGMACSILIILWVVDELNYDQFHEDSDQIFQVMEHRTYSGDIGTSTGTPGILAPALKENVPEFQYAATYTWDYELWFTKDDKSLKESGRYARPDFLRILSLPLIHGKAEGLLESPKTVVISQDLAKRYFGDENPVGESITINREVVHTITGVFENLPENSSFQFDFLLPFEDWLKRNEWAREWGNDGPRTIAKLYPNTDVDALNARIHDFIKERKENSNVDLFVYPFSDLYLYGQFEAGKVVGGRIDYVRLFSVVAIFILLIACINFMNLSTAKATRRAREVGIRKSMGAGKGSLIGQFIGESMIISFFSLLLSVVLVELCLPLFNDLMDKAIDINYAEPSLLLIFAGTALLTGFIAGSYPAFYLSSFEAVRTLKGSLKSSGGEVFARKGLVVFQFTLSVVLIASTIMVYKQIQYTQTKNLGYNKENLLYFGVEGDIAESWDAFRARLLDMPDVTHVSRAAATFMGKISGTDELEWPGKDPETEVRFEAVRVDYGLIETLGFELADGRTFSEEYGADTPRIVINRAAADIMGSMGMEDPVGKLVTLWGEEMEIIGLVKDFHFQNLRYGIEPLIFLLAPQASWRAYVRVKSGNIQNTLAQMERIYKQFNLDYPFDYHFMDEQYATLYRSEQRVGDLAKYFSIFAIIISCLGLFGLSAFTAEQRSKEIGVRKVLGASVQNLVVLLNKDFTKLVIIAICIAVPLSWWLMHQWLSGFAYQSGLDWWIFALSGVLAIVIAWLTVSWQSIKAALANPVESLRSE